MIILLPNREWNQKQKHKNSLGACPKDKNRSPFHGEKPLMKIILW